MAFGHAEHGEPQSEQQGIQSALRHKTMMIEKPDAKGGLTLGKSWRKVTETKIHKKSFRYFIVSLYNASQETTLYPVVSTYGQLRGANFTGEFEGL
ncbi:MAG: hypothetical protein ACI9P7_002312 [Candidatus Azotimanducaceae bacterium]|jgi:hypothetical protein